jgi:hypothetical protein
MKINIGEGKGGHKIFRGKRPLVPADLEDQLLSRPAVNGRLREFDYTMMRCCVACPMVFRMG